MNIFYSLKNYISSSSGIEYFITFYKRILLLLLIYSISRLSFLIFNLESFKENILLSLLEGIRFDISAIFYINIPILILIIFPTNLRKNDIYQKVTNIIFYIINIPFIIINNIDIEYFKFSQKRITFDFVEYLSLGGGHDAFIQTPQFIIDYWHVTLLTIIQVYFLLRIKRIPSRKINLQFRSISKDISIFIISIGILIIGARGGIQLKPIKPIDAGILSDINNSILVLNSPFCFLHTINEDPLKEYNYFNNQEIDKIYPTKHQYSSNQKIKNNNVVIIILESFSKEFIGFHNNGNGYTPFLDSLMKYSLVMNNAYSNGIKSIEALPAITSSIPTLMNNPFITSPYAVNRFNSIASLLDKEGYSSSFFHGGSKGTMGFYQYSQKAQFDKYFGREEYNNDDHYDGSWGIYDEEFIKYYADFLSIEKTPFVSCFFSLSSHPPYGVPEKYKHKNWNGKLEIHKSIRYTDYALKKFFDKVKKYQWYKNTLFVITADHTSPQNSLKKYNNKVGRYSIPIIYFQGDGSLIGESDKITQQIDIMPTVLEIIGYNKKFFSFGKSIFNQKENEWAISFINNEYLLIHKDGYLVGRGEEYTNFLDKNLRKRERNRHNKIKLLKAIKQKYNNRMLHNKLNTNEM